MRLERLAALPAGLLLAPTTAVACDPAEPAREEDATARVDPPEIRAHARRLLVDDRRRLRNRRQRGDLPGERAVDDRTDRDHARLEIVRRARSRIGVLPPRERARDGRQEQHGEGRADDHAPSERRDPLVENPVDRLGVTSPATGGRAVPVGASEDRRHGVPRAFMAGHPTGVPLFRSSSQHPLG